MTTAVVVGDKKAGIPESAHTVDLESYRTPGVRCFIGRERGEWVRSLAGLDAAAARGEAVHVRIPEDVYCVTRSFTEELIKDLPFVVASGPAHLVAGMRDAVARLMERRAWPGGFFPATTPTEGDPR